MNEAALIRCTRVAKLYNERLIFKDVTFAVHPGSVTLLTGVNGAGKSTLLRILSGLAQPTRGTVDRHTKDTETGYLGHGAFLYPKLTARENLFFWGRMQKLPEKELMARVETALENMELSAFGDDKAGNFSKGMCQRLNLARVFLGNPSLVLLDEPGAGLDTRSMKLLRREITKARETGAGVVWVSHAVDADSHLADRVLCLEEKTLKGATDA